ncbi:MAG: aspartate carbamoyltransferase regulatory subunit [Clostridium sp.]
MMEIKSIKKGIVIDHIKAGLGLKIFNYLGLEHVDYAVALIMNASSDKNTRKDIIKIENEIDLDFRVLGFIDPSITINIIEDEKVKEKISLNLPKQIENVIRCSNPRCITSIEQEIVHKFYLVEGCGSTYRCGYCDEAYVPTV